MKVAKFELVHQEHLIATLIQCKQYSEENISANPELIPSLDA